MQQILSVDLQKRINAFSRLGECLRYFGIDVSEAAEKNDNKYFEELKTIVKESYLNNGWFIEKNVRNMLFSLGESLEKGSLEKWVSKYYDKLNVERQPKTVAVVMAGNVPVVGFHDFLSVLMSGNRILAKLSSDDDKLLPAITDLLISIEAGFDGFVIFADGKLKGFDAVIATGSGNTSRYFDYYFGKYKNIIRHNRNGVAVLRGDEIEGDFELLAHDIFMYFGLGCRNISKLFVPEGYDFVPMLDVFSKNEEIRNHHKYFNNYEYNKAIYLVNSRQHLDAGNLLLVEDEVYASPVSVLNFEYYSNIEDLNRKLMLEANSIQCVVSGSEEISNSIGLGQSQQSQLWDYADGVDTMEFLLGLD